MFECPNNQRNNHHLNDLAEYCWLVYRKALLSKGPMLIGRANDLWQEK